MRLRSVENEARSYRLEEGRQKAAMRNTQTSKGKQV